jgi:hypothetical protein
MAGEVNQIARCRENILAAAGDFTSDIGQYYLAGPSLDHRNAERLLKVANLHR